MIKYIVKYIKYICEYKTNIFGETLDESTFYTQFDKFCLKEYLKSNKFKLPLHITKEIIMNFFNDLNK